MASQINLTNTRKFVIDLSFRAGEILKKYYNSGNFTQKSKGGVDFLTQADSEVDSFILESLRNKFPADNFLTEETAAEDYSSLKQAENVWVVDPLDGTVNFSRQTPNFAVSIALVNKSKTVLGVTYKPITGDLYWAQTDLPDAFHNDQPIHVSHTRDFKQTVVATDWPWKLESRMQVVNWMKNICTSVRQIKAMGSAVSDLSGLAEGKIDIYMHSGLKPWDVAAVSLLIEKAGGKITTPNGESWDVFEPEILASNSLLHTDFIKLINK
jgi:myo-inositol-1(or 4)-monophosphatase